MAELAQLLPPPTGPRIGKIEVHVNLKETHTRSAEVTEHPIERGSPVADHRSRKSAELLMEGIVLPDFPPPTPDLKPADRSTGPNPAINSAYRELLDLEQSGVPFDVVTKLALYENMLFESFSVDRDKETGNIIKFTAKLKQIRYADSVVVKLHKVPEKTRGKKSLGPKGTKTADAKTTATMRSTLEKQMNPGSSQKTLVDYYKKKIESLDSFLGGGG